MRVLLDTHTFLWFVEGNPELSTTARDLIEDASTISFLSIASVSTLPFHHRDPFGRMLVAQCLDDSMTLVSRDTILDNYPVTRVW